MLGGGKLGAHIETALGDCATGPVIVVDDVKLATVLKKRGVAVIAVADSEKKLRKYSGEHVVGPANPLPVESGSAAAVVGLAPADDAAATYADWLRATRDGGVVIAIAKRVSSQTAGALLCGGLTDIRQRAAGRSTLLVGRVAGY